MLVERNIQYPTAVKQQFAQGSDVVYYSKELTEKQSNDEYCWLCSCWPEIISVMLRYNS